MPLKIGHHMDHYAGQLCKGILMLSEPAHQETEKRGEKSVFFIHFRDGKASTYKKGNAMYSSSALLVFFQLWCNF
jgi:hypothetical protein